MPEIYMIPIKWKICRTNLTFECYYIDYVYLQSILFFKSKQAANTQIYKNNPS